MFQLANTHPRWSRLRQAKGIPGIVVAHQTASRAPCGENLKTLARVRPNPDRIACVDKKIDPKAVNGGDRRLQCR
jgi:hypothetical protein